MSHLRRDNIVHFRKWTFFSGSCRPSIKNLNAHLAAFASTLSTPVVKRFIFCLDSNAKNPFWNSATLDPKGKVVETFFESIGATVATVPLKYLRHVPLNSSFIDVTAFGDLVTLSDWKFLDIPSLADQPFISFTISMPTQSRVERQPIQPKPFPNPAFCSAEKYLSLLPNAVNDLAPLCPTTKLSRATIDEFNASLLDRMKSCASQSKLPYHPSNVPGKMPWWIKALTELGN